MTPEIRLRVKKLICNNGAQYAAIYSDHEVASRAQAALAMLDVLEGDDLAWFQAQESAVAEAYLEARKNAKDEFVHAFDEIIEELNNRRDDAGAGPVALGE